MEVIKTELPRAVRRKEGLRVVYKRWSRRIWIKLPRAQPAGAERSGDFVIKLASVKSKSIKTCYDHSVIQLEVKEKCLRRCPAKEINSGAYVKYRNWRRSVEGVSQYKADVGSLCERNMLKSEVNWRVSHGAIYAVKLWEIAHLLGTGSVVSLSFRNSIWTLFFLFFLCVCPDASSSLLLRSLNHHVICLILHNLPLRNIRL